MKTWLLLAIVTATVGGGFTGVAAIAQSLSEGHGSGVWSMSFLVFYSLVIASGLVLVTNPSRTRPALVALLIQIPWFSSPLATYRFVAGCDLRVGFMGGSVKLGALLGSYFQFGLFSQNPWGGGVNLFALALVLALRISSQHAMPSAKRSAEAGLGL